MFYKNQQKNYVCVFRKSILDSQDIVEAESITNLTCRLELPFIPFIGLQVTDALFDYNDKPELGRQIDVEDEFYSGKIEAINWDNSVELFYCDTEDHILSENNNLGAVINFYLKKGWDLDYSSLEDIKYAKEYLKKKEQK